MSAPPGTVATSPPTEHYPGLLPAGSTGDVCLNLRDAGDEDGLTEHLIGLGFGGGKARRYSRTLINAESERVARAVLYAMLPAALTDGSFRSRGDGLQSRPTEARGIHNAHVRSGERI